MSKDGEVLDPEVIGTALKLVTGVAPNVMTIWEYVM